MSKQVLLDLNEIADKIVEIAKGKMQMNDEKLTPDDIACLISGIDKPSKCDDCISRQAVIDIIHNFFAEEINKIPTEKTEDGDVLTMGKLNPFLTMNKTLSRRIKELPSVPAEPQDKDIIWYDKRNYSEIVVKPQGRSEKE